MAVPPAFLRPSLAASLRRGYHPSVVPPRSLFLMLKRCAPAVIVLGLIVPLALFALCSRPDTAAPAGPPRLAVLVYFDQLRGDYPARWDELFGEGGFHRLEKDGAWFQNCHYPYANTITGAGHASVATGCSPQTHGIIANEWYDRA